MTRDNTGRSTEPNEQRTDKQESDPREALNREDVLRRSQIEHHHRDLVGEEIDTTISSISAIVALVLAVLFFMLEAVLRHEFNYALFTIVFSFGATSFIVKAVRMRRRKDIILGVIYSLSTLGCAIIALVQIVHPDMLS